MGLSLVQSRALLGLQATAVTVEVHLANGLPSFTLVGLADVEVKEARERVRCAIQNSNLQFPNNQRITVNLAPADLPKESGRFDLPIALGILAASGQIPAAALAEYEFAGELALTGELRPFRGALAMAWRAVRDGRAFILPQDNAAEAALVQEARVYAAGSLLQVCAHLAGAEKLALTPRVLLVPPAELPDLADVKGQTHARRALEIAAAGRHNLLMVGPPGTGKSMLASRLPGILPPMNEDEALQSAAIQSLTGSFQPAQWGIRVFRQPHHTASSVALVGGGSVPRPGEISLAHCGVLFLDELPEFDRKVLEVLREPLESGRICISRAARQAEFPAQFQLIAAMNPCPCGYLGDPSGRCRCTPDQVSRYRGKLSGPFLDRIDLQIEVPSLSHHELLSAATGESSRQVQHRVARAYALQLQRQGKANALLGSREIDQWCAPDAEGEQLLKLAITRLNLSARAYHRILKVARTIADLAASSRISSQHIAEAVQLRKLERSAGA